MNKDLILLRESGEFTVFPQLSIRLLWRSLFKVTVEIEAELLLLLFGKNYLNIIISSPLLSEGCVKLSRAGE